ncbi:MAG: hypothetical protein V1765_01835 [bacterium]
MLKITGQQATSLILCCLAFVFLGAVQSVQAERCADPAEVTVIVRDTDREFIPDLRFTVYEQVLDVDNEKTIGRSIGGGKIETYIGSGLAKVYPYSETQYYIVKVDNPTLTNLDFWFFDAMSLYCGKKTTITLYLSALKVSATDTQGQLLKNIKFSVYEQKNDPQGGLIVGEDALGSFDTGDTGQSVVYVPTKNTSLGKTINFYALKFRSPWGKDFFRWNLNGTDQKMMDISYVFSDLLVSVKEATTGAVMPNISLSLHEQILDNMGNPTAGQQLSITKTNDLGQAYWVYPAGTYFVRFKYSDGRTADLPNIVINNQQRTTTQLLLEDDAKRTSKCTIKSTLDVSFRNGFDQIVKNKTFSLYEQLTDNDNQPVPGNKIVGGKLDENGLGRVQFNPEPVNHYILTLCDQTIKFGCFNFKDIQFDCSDRLFFERYLTQVDIILRNSNKQPLVDQRLKIFSRIKDVDGKQIVDENSGFVLFKVPDSGQVSLFLAHKDIHDKPLGYILMVENPGLPLYATLDLKGGWNGFQYIMQTDKLLPLAIPRPALVTKNLGKIMLQVERNGEAWYMSPSDGRRYFLGRPADAYAVMRKLSVGINNGNLTKIPVSLDLMSKADRDIDNDGLADVLEKGLLTNWQHPDTDGDGFNDLQEVKGNYSPYGKGRWVYDDNFARVQSGKILLQVEANGEAWYIYPNNYKRYYLGRDVDAFGIMRGLGLGISNANLAVMPVGVID